MDLVHIRRLQRVTLEFTTRCNLKCTYCAVTRPWHPKRDLDLSEFDSVIAEMRSLGVEQVQISGAGETTIVKDWDVYLDKLLEAGIRVAIISNLAKPLTPRAVRALSRCTEITTSCDTADPALFAAIRNGGTLDLFLENIRAIRTAAAAEGRTPPRLIWNAVANDRVIFDVERWVAAGLEAGVDHFQISELTQFPDLPGVLNVRPIGTLSTDDLSRAKAVVAGARAVAEAAGKAFTVVPAVEEVLGGVRKVMVTIPDVETTPEGKQRLKSSRRFVQILGDDGEARPLEPVAQERNAAPGTLTRNCLLPWSEAFVWASNEIAPCCMLKGISPFEGRGFLEALNSPGFTAIREGLLSGNLHHTCNLCPMFELVETRALVERVRAHLGG